MELLLLSDEGLAVLVPIVVYWAYCGLHVALGQSIHMDKYRLHPSTHEDTKNYVSKRQVISNVLKQELVQVTVVAMVFKVLRVHKINIALHACMIRYLLTYFKCSHPLDFLQMNP